MVALPAPTLLRSAEALAAVGPGAFGLSDVLYSPVGPYSGVEPVPKATRRESSSASRDEAAPFVQARKQAATA